MKTKHYLINWAAAWGTVIILMAAPGRMRAQGTTAFTYQGQLRDNGTNANGNYTMIFKLYDAASGGNPVGNPNAITNSPTLVNGLFTVDLDFGAAGFNGSARYLDITITNDGVTQTLSPRVQILPTPYAIMAGSASNALTAATASSVPAANISGTISDAQLSANVALRAGGNAFSGNQMISGGSIGIGAAPTESLLINGGNAFIIGSNAGAPGASGSLFLGSDSNTRDGALLRTTNGDMAFWRYNGIWNETMRMLNGSGNVGIGRTNPATALDVNGTVTATSFSGNGNGLTSVAHITGGNAFSGNQTITNGNVGIGTATPGYTLDINGSTSLPAGSAGSLYFDGHNASGQEWQLFHNASEAFGPTNGLVFYNATAQSSELVIAPSGNIGIGKVNPVTTLDVNGTVTATGFSGSATGLTGVAQLAGGNAFSGDQTITGGRIGIGSNPTESLLINGGNAFIIGANPGAPGASGSLFLGSNSSTRDGALLRTTTGDLAFWRYNGIWSETMRMLNSSGNVGIGKTNPATALDVNGTVAATSFSGDATGLTGVAHLTGGNAFGGNQVITNGNVGIGTATPGYTLDINGNMSLPAGSAGSLYFDGHNASGQEWQLFHNASETFGPVNGLVFYNATAGSSTLVIAPSGNVGIGNNNPTNTLMVVNARCDGSTWINSSDRNLKENFTWVNSHDILEKVMALPITQWNYKTDANSKHLGPVAQDFKSAFNLGNDDKSISTIDESGVALAAIQGLNKKMEEKEAMIQAQATEIQDLNARLEKLEQLLNAKNGGGR